MNSILINVNNKQILDKFISKYLIVIAIFVFIAVIIAGRYVTLDAFQYTKDYKKACIKAGGHVISGICIKGEQIKIKVRPKDEAH